MNSDVTIQKKVLIASFTFPPNKDGVSEAASVMAEGFLRKGWKVDIATSPTKPARLANHWQQATIHEFTIKGDAFSREPFSGDVDSYLSFLQQGSWDIIIFHAYYWSIYIPLENLHRISGRKILVSHGFPALQWIRVRSFPWGLATLLRNILRSLQMCLWIHKIDRTVYLSERTDFRGFFDHWIAKVVKYKGRRIIPNGVDPNLLSNNGLQFRNDFGIAQHEVCFLCVANYSRRKDQGYAARAFHDAAIPNAIMVFIGSEFNCHSAHFQNEIARLKIKEPTCRIIWLENIDRETTMCAFAACDVFVLSSDHEAQPIALLEAMRESKPWIARDSGCISEMPGGKFIKSQKEMTKQMINFANDQNLRRALGKKGRDAVGKTYNRQHYIDSYCKLIEEIADSPS